MEKSWKSLGRILTVGKSSPVPRARKAAKNFGVSWHWFNEFHWLETAQNGRYESDLLRNRYDERIISSCLGGLCNCVHVKYRLVDAGGFGDLGTVAFIHTLSIRSQHMGFPLQYPWQFLTLIPYYSVNTSITLEIHGQTRSL